ncbi:Protein of unknown function DUF3425 [Penicillium capsulatum]|uniref:BZIP domain-containing protein n=1 Tax=Penicillium capsulatum TaxID=69766 RepID=A0A9W9IPH2_9EURO|nr:Protein of unknown function DUF3425 [Penicillium capsulatum]KAJ6130534.1 Protein of unknown function DUF3425 [Penicillium capsulatum]
MSDLSMADRKRLRDRRSQQTLRDKKLRYTAKLEERVTYCEEHHHDQSVQRLLQIIQGLQAQNEVLKSRQERLKCLFNTWDRDLETDPLASRADGSDPHPGEDPFRPRNGCRENISISPSGVNGFVTPPALSPIKSTPDTPDLLYTASVIPATGTQAPWNRVPLINDDFSDVQKLSCPWFNRLEEIIPCPNTPSSPLDLLYGTKANALADGIHTGIQRRPVRDPERLGLGWIVYHLTRWIISPSPETYDRLPSFLRPTEDQLQIAHPACLDAIPWPKMRQNLIHRWDFYYDQRDTIFGLLACCTKIRWPWGVDILERNADNELCIKPEFYETFMSLDGWGLTPEFVSQYPDLMTGMDGSSVVYTVI